MVKRIKKPSLVQAKLLGSLFPSSQSSPQKRSLAFDPTAECVVTSQQKKKKKGIKNSRNRICKVSCFLVSNLERGVPRGNYRIDLKKNGKEAMIEIKRKNACYITSEPGPSKVLLQFIKLMFLCIILFVLYSHRCHQPQSFLCHQNQNQIPRYVRIYSLNNKH